MRVVSVLDGAGRSVWTLWSFRGISAPLGIPTRQAWRLTRLEKTSCVWRGCSHGRVATVVSDPVCSLGKEEIVLHGVDHTLPLLFREGPSVSRSLEGFLWQVITTPVALL